MGRKKKEENLLVDGEDLATIEKEAENAFDVVVRHQAKTHEIKNHEAETLSDEEEKELREKAISAMNKRIEETRARQEKEEAEAHKEHKSILKLFKNHENRVGYSSPIHHLHWYVVNMPAMKNGRYKEAAEFGLIEFVDQLEAKQFLVDNNLIVKRFIIMKGWDLTHKEMLFFKRCKDAEKSA